MVSFDDIQNINLRAAKFQKPEYQNLKNTLFNLWILGTCYILSTSSLQVTPSIMSLLGMYYALSDVITYYYNNHIVKTDTVVEENDVSQDNNLTEEVIYEDDDNDDDNDDDEGSDEVAEDDEFDNDSSEKTTTMMTSVFRRTTPVNTYDTENEARNIKAIEQLKAYADMIHQKNLENKYRESDDDYSDMPPLVKISSNSWYTSNLPPYMNPNLRQSGHYAPSQNETDE